MGTKAQQQQAIEMILLAGWCEAGETKREVVRVGTSAHPVYGGIGGEKREFGGRPRFVYPTSTWRVTVGQHTINFYQVSETPGGETGNFSQVATADLDALADKLRLISAQAALEAKSSRYAPVAERIVIAANTVITMCYELELLRRTGVSRADWRQCDADFTNEVNMLAADVRSRILAYNHVLFPGMCYSRAKSCAAWFASRSQFFADRQPQLAKAYEHAAKLLQEAVDTLPAQASSTSPA